MGPSPPSPSLTAATVSDETSLRELTDALAAVAQEVDAQRATLRRHVDPATKQRQRDLLDALLRSTEALRAEQRALRERLLEEGARTLRVVSALG